MMMFMSHASFALEILAFLAAAYLFIWALRNEGAGISFAKLVGVIAMVVSIFALLCTTYYTVSYWEHGYFRPMMGMERMHHKPMMDKGMMGEGMTDRSDGMRQPAERQ